MFVLDEADEMLSRGFKDQIYDIFQKLSSNAQVSPWGQVYLPHPEICHWIAWVILGSGISALVLYLVLCDKGLKHSLQPIGAAVLIKMSVCTGLPLGNTVGTLGIIFSGCEGALWAERFATSAKIM